MGRYRRENVAGADIKVEKEVGIFQNSCCKENAVFGGCII